MATVTFTYNHARDPMNPGDLASKILASLSLTSMPVVDITPTQIIVTHPSITDAANRTAIQTVINAYVLDPTWASLPADNQGLVLTRARAALTTNATFLAVASPTTAQVTAQTKALTRQVNGVLRALLGDFTDVSGT